MKTNNSIFDLTTRVHLFKCLEQIKLFRPSLDINAIEKTALMMVKRCHGAKRIRPLAIERQWYESLRTGVRDFTIYNTDDFIGDLWACWVVYSRKYLLALRTAKTLKPSRKLFPILGVDVRTIADLGCGFGYTTAGLKELFPLASVYGTNLEGTTQYEYAKEFGQGLARHEVGFAIVPNVEAIGKPVDLIFASEYFEHFERPVEHLCQILTSVVPRYLIIANSFGARAAGHFPKYRNGGTIISNKKIGRLFSKELRGNGYRQLKTNLWNQRPQIWKKV